MNKSKNLIVMKEKDENQTNEKTNEVMVAANNTSPNPSEFYYN